MFAAQSIFERRVISEGGRKRVAGGLRVTGRVDCDCNGKQKFTAIP